MYNKAFTEVVMVKLTTDKVGNQLQIGSDVKARGVIVGEVRKITPTADGAQLDLALNPDQAKLLPNTVSARFLPKTLFGERYVALQLPKESGGTPLAAGNAIAQDTSARAAELETAFEHLLPVLQAVQPAKLSSTLTAISTALQGRGKPLGETLTDLGDLVGEINPHLPQLEHDLRVLTTVSDTYADAAPDLVSALDDLTVTSQTVVDQRSNLDALYASVTTASRDLDSFLRVNQGNLIQLADTVAAHARTAREVRAGVPLLPQADRRDGAGDRHGVGQGHQPARPARHDRGRRQPGPVQAGQGRAALRGHPRSALLRLQGVPDAVPAEPAGRPAQGRLDAAAARARRAGRPDPGRDRAERAAGPRRTRRAG